ncbi:MAG: uroporphyrinogen-III synthase, partial [Deltaproteobacteria bacterium]|nr:uroporphyrinogen-III synthase [Deltaproteobacteria bacterium]
TSSSTVENFVGMLGAPLAREIAARTVFASIGPQTTRTLAQFDLTCAVEAEPHDVPGLVTALARQFARR